MKCIKFYTLSIIMVFGLTISSCQSDKNQKKENVIKKPVKVELKHEHGKYQLFVAGNPFYIKGAGLEYGNIESLAKHGGNSFRTWRVDNGKVSGQEVLDKAYENGLMVCMGIDVARERHGFDYNDEEAVKKQFEQIKKDVLQLKDHPAMLMWGIGNELNLHYSNPKVWDAVNEIAAMIHKEDPNHPTTTMLAGANKNEIVQVLERCPELDLMSFQLYGEIKNLPRFIKESGYKGAYIVSEWGATGHWEVDKTEWGRPIEQNSHEKATAYYERYNNVILADSSHCIGSFVFLWGQKQERTPTWYGVFLENGDKTESVDAMEYVWTGKRPTDPTPVFQSMKLDGRKAKDNIYLEEGKTYRATASIKNSQGGEVIYSWNILYEVDHDKESDGGDFEPKPEMVLELVGDDIGPNISFKAPGKGEYRLFVYGSNGKGSSATSNIPFKVK